MSHVYPRWEKSGKQKSWDKRSVDLITRAQHLQLALGLHLCIEPYRLQMPANVCLCFPFTSISQKKVYSTLFYLKTFKNHPEYSMAADLSHPSLGKLLGRSYVTLARHIVLQAPNFDPFIYPFIARKKNRLIKCNSLNAHALWDIATKPLLLRLSNFTWY